METLKYSNQFEKKDENLFKEGDMVKIKRGNGRMEEGWRVLGVFSGMAVVEKSLTEEEAIAEKAAKIAAMEKKIADLSNMSIAQVFPDDAETRRLKKELGALRAMGIVKAVEKRVSIEDLKQWQLGVPEVDKVNDLESKDKEVVLNVGDVVNIPSFKSYKGEPNWKIESIEGSKVVVTKSFEGNDGQADKIKEMAEMQSKIKDLLNSNLGHKDILGDEAKARVLEKQLEDLKSGKVNYVKRTVELDSLKKLNS